MGKKPQEVTIKVIRSKGLKPHTVKMELVVLAGLISGTHPYESRQKVSKMNTSDIQKRLRRIQSLIVKEEDIKKALEYLAKPEILILKTQ